MHDIEFQTHMDALFRRIDLEALAGLIDFDAAQRRMRGPARDYLGHAIDIPGLPARPGFGARLFVCRKGHAVARHGG